MARYTGSKCKLCRREGQKLFLKGERCYTDKCALERRNTPPGDKPKKMRRKKTGYAIQLREKQKVKRIYGVLEKQFKGYFREATRMKGITGHNLLQLLERRLDNVVYRLGFAPSRSSARQLVRHSHIKVNGRKVNIPSYIVSVGDEISIKDKSKSMNLILASLERNAKSVPNWLELDLPNSKGIVKMLPDRDAITDSVQEQLIVELYSK